MVAAQTVAHTAQKLHQFSACALLTSQQNSSQCFRFAALSTANLFQKQTLLVPKPRLCDHAEQNRKCNGGGYETGNNSRKLEHSLVTRFFRCSPETCHTLLTEWPPSTVMMLPVM